jgi:hypothetical protein
VPMEAVMVEIVEADPAGKMKNGILFSERK